MAISAGMVKELRELTGSGMMECKKALEATDGNLEAAIEWMRKAGLARADKKAGRIAADGLISLQFAANGKRGVILEVNCETDFVAKGDDFKEFVGRVGQIALERKPRDLDALLSTSYGTDGTVGEARQRLVAKIGENIAVRRFSALDATAGFVAGYQHGTRIGVLVEMEGAGADGAHLATVAKDIAMHIAASRPMCVAPSDVATEIIGKEKEIYRAQAADSGKPAEIIEKMVMGRVSKFLKEVALLGQPFVKDPDQTVEKLLQQKKAKVLRFVRYEVGEGIEKQTTNFADEVMSAVRGS